TQYSGKADKFGATKFTPLEPCNETHRQLIPALRKKQGPEINKYLNRNSPFSGIWENIIHHEEDDLPEETKKLMVEYLHPKLRKLFVDLNANPFIFFLNGHKAFKTVNLQPVGLSPDVVTPFFQVAEGKDGYALTCYVKINGQAVDLSRNECGSPMVFFYNNNIYLWNRPEDIPLVERFIGHESRTIARADWPAQLRDFILPL